MSVGRCATRHFSGQGGFDELGHFEKNIVKNTRKKRPAGKHFEDFLLDTLKTIF